MHKIILLSLLFFAVINLYSQELNCGVTINTQYVTKTDPKVFKTLETSIKEFLNTRKWTDDVFKPEERIDCELIITIREELGSNKYNAEASIISRRPVYGTDYNTVLLNTIDKDWQFQYVEYQPLDYNENSFLSNITSMLAYYAYIIIGLDYDSFALKGGDKYFQNALAIVSQASNREENGWKSYDGTRNRYWLINNILDPKLSGFRDAFYQYHRLGLDMMSTDPAKPVATFTKCFQIMDNINRVQPNTMIMQLFFSAKSDEIQGIYSKALPADKSKAVGYLLRLDPVNAAKYQALLTGK